MDNVFNSSNTNCVNPEVKTESINPKLMDPRITAILPDLDMAFAGLAKISYPGQAESAKDELLEILDRCLTKADKEKADKEKADKEKADKEKADKENDDQENDDQKNDD